MKCYRLFSTQVPHQLMVTVIYFFQALNGYRRSFDRSQVMIVGLAAIDQVNLYTWMPLLQPLA